MGSLLPRWSWDELALSAIKYAGPALKSFRRPRLTLLFRNDAEWWLGFFYRTHLCSLTTQHGIQTTFYNTKKVSTHENKLLKITKVTSLLLPWVYGSLEEILIWLLLVKTYMRYANEHSWEQVQKVSLVSSLSAIMSLHAAKCWMNIQPHKT